MEEGCVKNLHDSNILNCNTELICMMSIMARILFDLSDRYGINSTVNLTLNIWMNYVFIFKNIRSDLLYANKTFKISKLLHILKPAGKWCKLHEKLYWLIAISLMHCCNVKLPIILVDESLCILLACLFTAVTFKPMTYQTSIPRDVKVRESNATNIV
jgi:hypothetical protein